uniref:Uncharacterized protein n=1 Tax=Streptomyces sp. FR1 TaxID=349971 RepID=V9Z2Y3_9ACTN|nr:hypothetical protein pFRL3_130c [Streptomyces sp. FR1]
MAYARAGRTARPDALRSSAAGSAPRRGRRDRTGQAVARAPRPRHEVGLRHHHQARGGRSSRRREAPNY